MVLSWGSDEALIYIAVLAVISAWAFIALWASFKRYRLINDTPTSKVRSAAQGFVELYGTATILKGEPILSPLTRQPCCWWRYRIQRRVRTGKSTRWSTIDKGESDGIFALNDGTGQALIDPSNAEVTGSQKKTWYGNSRHPSHIVSGLSAFGGSYRYVEETLALQSQLYVIGNLRSENPTGDFNLHQAVGEKLKQWKQNQALLLARFDANQDGEICQQEWAAVRKTAKTEVEEQYASLLDNEPIHLVSKPTQRIPFLISTFAPTKLAKRYFIQSTIAAPAFLVTGGFAFWIATLRDLI